MKQDDDGDFMLIIYEGRAIVTVDSNKVAEKNTNDVVGETALQTKTKRKATVTAMTKCRCLVISKNDYDGAVDLFKTLQKHKTNEILKQLRHLQGWDSMKVKAFSSILSESSFTKGQGKQYWLNSLKLSIIWAMPRRVCTSSSQGEWPWTSSLKLNALSRSQSARKSGRFKEPFNSLGEPF